MREASGAGNITHRMTAMPIRQALQLFATMFQRRFWSKKLAQF